MKLTIELQSLSFADILIHIAEWKYFKIGTALSYGIYLIQFLVFHYFIGLTRSSTYFFMFNTYVSKLQVSLSFKYFNYSNIQLQFNMNTYFMIWVSSLFLAVFVEYPFGNLKKLIFDNATKIKAG